MLGHFSHVLLFVTLWTVARQAPLSMGFSRREYWSGLPFPSPMHESESEVAQSCPTLSNPVDCSLPGSSVHGIFQARILEWRAIAFSSLPLVPLKNDLILAQMVPLHEMFSNSLSRNLHTCIKIIAVHTVFISRISTRPYKRE